MGMKRAGILIGLALVLTGCAGGGGFIPVVDSGRPVSNEDMRTGAGMQTQAPGVTAPQDAGVVVMVPDGAGGSMPVQSYPVDVQPPVQSGSGVFSPPGSNLQGDEQLAGPVLALLTTAREQEGRGDLGGASSSLERAMRIAPREPQVFYRLAQVRLAQGDAAQAEQMAQRGLSFAAGRATLQAGLWELIAQAREQQGNQAGAAEARQRARVSL